MLTVSPEDEQYLESKLRFYRLVVAIEQVISMLLLVSLFVLIVSQVAARYVFTTPIVGSEEVARFIFIWFTFAGAAFVAARRKHITVELYSGRATGRVVAAIEAFAYATMIAVSVAMVVGGVLMVRNAGAMSSPGAGIPFLFVYSALPIGFALIAIHASLNLVLSLRHPKQFVGKQEAGLAGR